VTLVDARGRLFGLVNLIELAIGLAASASVGLGVAAYRVFDIPVPVLERVEPAEVVVGPAPHVTLVGRHFRHYLHAFVPRSGAPFAVTPGRPEGPEARFASVTDERVDLQLPALAPGTYDLHLFDDNKRLAYRPSAFTVVPPPYPRGVVDVHLDVFLHPGQPDLVKAGDEDIVKADPAVPTIGAARVAAVRVTPETTEDREIAFGQYEKHNDYQWISRLGRRLIVDVTLSVPVLQTRTGRWEYKNVPVRVGETITFETANYKVSGPVVSVGQVQPWR
jgi:hypothetical protein